MDSIIANDKMTVENSGLHRLSLIIGLAKFVFGTLVLGCASLILNYQYQQNQLDLEREKSKHAIDLQEKQAEFDYLSKFMQHAMNEDLNVRIRLANYMQSVALSKNIKGIWTSYHQVLVASRDDAEAKRTQLLAEETKLAATLATVDQKQSAIRVESIKKIDDVRREILYIQDQIDRKKYGTFENNYVDIQSVLSKADLAKQSGKYKNQLEHLTEALSVTPDSMKSYVLTEISSAYRSLRQFDKAEAYMDRATALRPADPNTLYMQAIMQKNNGRLGKAIETLKRAETSSNGDMKLVIQIALAGYLIHNKQVEQGMKLFESIREKAKNRSSTSINLAWFYAVAKQKDNFYAALEKALVHNASSTLHWLGKEVDVDIYREDKKFKDLLSAYSSSN